MTGTLDLLDHEPPAGRALEREPGIVDTIELRKPCAHRPTSRRTDPAARDLAATDVES
jgi:hypothetical protein